MKKESKGEYEILHFIKIVLLVLYSKMKKKEYFSIFIFSTDKILIVHIKLNYVNKQILFLSDIDFNVDNTN